MTLLQKRLLILLAVILAAAVLGRLVVRAILNLLLGGKLCDVFAAMWRPLIRRLGVGFKKEETT